MHFFVRFLRCLVLTIGWIFLILLWYAIFFCKKSTILFILFKNSKRHKMCLFLCTTNWPPFKLELRVLLKLLKVVFVIAVFYLCKMFYNNLLGNCASWHYCRRAKRPPSFLFYLLLLP